MADIEVKLKLTADGSVLVNTAKASESAVGELGSATVRAGQQASQGFDIAAKGSANLKAEMTEARNTAVELAAAVGGLTAIKVMANGFIDAADAQGQLDARMRRVTEGTLEQAIATARLRQIAHDAYEDINRLTEIFVRSVEVTKQLGISTAQTLDITEAMALSMVVSATAADKRQQSIDALSKAMQNGYIATEQLEGILAGAPRFVTALEQSLGKTRAELVGMARDGELTIGMVTRVSSELETLRAEVEDMPTTVEDAMVRWGNAFQSWASSTNEVYGSTAALVAMIDLVSANIDTVMVLAMMSATAVMGVLIHQGTLWLKSLHEQAAAKKLQAQATLEAARADLALQKQQEAAAIMLQRRAAAEVKRAEDALKVARADQEAARAAGLRATSEIALARASMAATQADIAATGAAAAMRQARIGEATAKAAMEAANKGLAASEADVQKALAGTKTQLLDLTSLISLAVAAVQGWQFGTYLREEFLVVERAGIALVSGLLMAWEKIKVVGVAAWEGIKAAALGGINNVRAAVADLLGLLATANEATDLFGLKAGITDKLRGMEQSIRPTTSAWDGFRDALGKALVAMGANERAIESTMADMWDYAAARRETIAAEQEFAREGTVSALAVDAALSKLNGSLRQQDAQLKEQIATHGKGRAAALEYAQALELAKFKGDDEAAQARYEAGVRALYAPLIENARALDAMSESTKRGKQETEAARKAAESYLEKLREEAATYGLSEDSKRRLAAASLKLSDAQQSEAKALLATIAGLARLTAALQPAYAAIDKLAAGHADLDEQLVQGRDALAGLAPAQIAYNAALRAQNALMLEAMALGPVTAEQQAEHEERLKKLEEQLGQTFDLDAHAEAARELESILSRFDDIGFSGLVRDIALVKKELAEATDEAEIARLENALASMNTELAIGSIEGFRSLLGAVQGFSKEGSKSFQQIEQAMAALSVVQAALATADAVRAILSAAAAPWPLNFPSMAAMAAAVAPLLSAIGAAVPAFSGGGGPSANSAAHRQEHQGSGTVLGDSAAKSESIARAVEITADATRELVGINRGMLNALQAMQSGIAGASTLLARSGAYGEFGALGNGQQGGLMTILGGLFSPIGGSFLTRAFANIFGGKESLRDEGIRIIGGYLSSMIDDIMVQSYQSIHRSGGWFRSSRDYDRFNDLGQDAAAQFQMVLGSMADAVRAAADALGLDMDEVNARIAAFQIEEIRISTMGLSAEEAQAELEAVFSAIFDGLAGHVVPFAAQFQRVGEGLAETLIRVATSVQVTQEAVRQLGISLDEADPERLAQISVGLVDLMGGVEEFIAGMTGFVSAFAPESHKFSVAQDALTRAFAQFGLEIPTSRDAMWELMQSLDATTASGREQIAMLLQLADVSDSYYQMLEDRASRMAAIDASIEDGAWQQYLDGLTDSQRAIEETTRYYDDWTAQLIASGATTEQLAAVEEQRAVAMGRVLAANAELAAQEQARLEAAGQRYADFITGIWRETVQLSDYQSAMMDADNWRTSAIATAHEHARAAGMAGASEQALALIELRASQLRAQALAQLREETQSLVDQLYGARGNDIGTAFTAGMESASNAAADYWEQQRRSAETLQQYLDSMLLGDLSALTPAEQLAEALSQFNAAVAAGDADQATQLADAYLRLLRGQEASGEDYNSGFWMIRDALQGMLDAIGPIPDAASGGADGSGYITAAGAEQIAAQNRLDLAVQLAQHLDDLAGAVGQTVWELMDSMGVDLRQLTADLGISLQSITGETVLALVNMADLLGTDLLTLTGQLGVSLTDMGAGIRELADQTGINLGALTVESVQALGGLANQLGIDLADIATSVGADLGSLADAQSLLNQALGAEILKLPADQASALENYFDSIVAATSEADANAAIDNMAGYINTLAPDIRNALAPYFEDVFPVDALTDLDYLTQIATDGAEQLAAAHAANALLSRIADNAMSANNAAGIPSYAVGTYNVPQTGPAILHAGEMVLPVPLANVLRDGSIGGSGSSDNGAMLAELRRLADKLDRIERAQTQGSQLVASTVAKTGAESDRNNDQSRARNAQAQRRGVTA